LNSAILTINNFQAEDLGIYICRVKTIGTSKQMLWGEKKIYLMASQFGFNRSEQILLNPDIELKVMCRKNSCKSYDLNQPIEIMCSTKNFSR